MKCQKCSRIATLHITEILSESEYEEHHLCEECAQQYLYEPQTDLSTPPSALASLEEEPGLEILGQQCPVCGLKFMEFRSTGRLGCAHDYEAFREDLIPLLENIHGDTTHCGKVPRRLPQARETWSELVELRKQLQQAIGREDYEEAAQLRDRIRQLEEA